VAGFVEPEHEGDGFVDRIGRGAEAEGVSVPVHVCAAPPVQRPGFVTRPEIMLVRRHHLAQAEATVRKSERSAWRVGEHGTAVGVADGERERGPIDCNLKRRGHDPRLGCVFDHGEKYMVSANFGRDCSRGIFGEIGVADANAQDIGSRHGQFDADAAMLGEIMVRWGDRGTRAEQAERQHERGQAAELRYATHAQTE
jgi:hypothetical protein